MGNSRSRTLYPPEVKQRVLEALAAGGRLEDVTEREAIPLGTVRNWYYQAKASGILAHLQVKHELAKSAPVDGFAEKKVTHHHSLDSSFLGKGGRCDEVKPAKSRAPAPGEIPFAGIHQKIPVDRDPSPSGVELRMTPPMVTPGFAHAVMEAGKPRLGTPPTINPDFEEAVNQMDDELRGRRQPPPGRIAPPCSAPFGG